ncbi:MAG: hypothetical protein ACO3XO_00890 [Bdellovibrionota bacterium]
MTSITKDIEFSHSLLSYLLSALQGEFAYQNILGRLGADGTASQELSDLQRKIQEVSGWLEQTVGGDPILKLDWNEPRGDAAKKALEMSREIITDLKGLAIELDSILSQRQFDEVSRSRLVILLAVLAKQTYARDNYFRCFYKLCKHFGNTEESARFRIGIKSSEKDIEHVNQLIAAFMSSQDLPLEFFHALFGEVIALPGLLRTQAFDLKLLAAAYQEEFSFEHANIPDDEGQLWSQIGITPQEAGHWNAYQISPKEAYTWIQAGIPLSAVAGLWKSWRFPASEAVGWYKAEFTPREASDWANSGFSPEEARQLINRGVSHPSLLKK